ncbi:MAG: hypothetical protein P8Y72_17145 [Anaerolineales bacterium]
MKGVASTLTTWRGGVTRLTAPPRATFTKLLRGMILGRPHDTEQQRRILLATLALLSQDAPIEPVLLEESAEE